MNIKSTALFALLMPGLVMLAACNRTPDTTDTAMTPPPPAMNDPTRVDTMPADTMGGMRGEGMSFAQMDRNSDGSITRDELTAGDMLHENFSMADADGNGMLSEAEVAQYRADMAASPTN
ncbi:MAG: hypothetical protein M3374_04600 [Pseudomonadota bacterium]|nr:hypothetical protein [Pseudomonadota bacterium]